MRTRSAAALDHCDLCGGRTTAQTIEPANHTWIWKLRYSSAQTAVVSYRALWTTKNMPPHNGGVGIFAAVVRACYHAESDAPAAPRVRHSPVHFGVRRCPIRAQLLRRS